MIEKIQALDLSYLEERIIKEGKISRENVGNAIRRYKNFLSLMIKYPGQTIVPTEDIDEVWHNHILHTKEYTRDCEAIFKSYKHHSPFHDHEDESAREEMNQKYYKTAELYIKEFQESYALDLDVATFW